MLDKLIDFAVHRRAITLVATLVLAVFGVVTFTKLKIEAFPDVTNVQVMVITLYPGQAAEEIEKQVTIPVERALTGTPRVLDPAVDHLVRAVAGDPDLRGRRRHLLGAPAGGGTADRRRGARRASRRTWGRTTRRSGRSTSTRWRAIATRPASCASWQDWVVSKNLMRAPGVADVVSFGGFQKEYHVLADPGRLRNAGLTLKDVIDAVAESNGATSGGYLQLRRVASSWCAAAAT